MDSLSQIVLGTGIAGAIAHKQLGRSALMIGAVLATLPDLDIFIPTADAVTQFTEHRSFSHSLLVLFPLAFFCFLLLKLKFKADIISNQRLFWLTSLPLVTHPILDAFTSYGTQLFWPLTTHPISIASIFAIDPLYTLPLLIGCIYLWRNSHHHAVETNKKIQTARRLNQVALIVSTGYLLLGLLLQTLMLNKIKNTLHSHNIATNKIFISPLYPSLNWWGAIVIDDNIYYDVEVNILSHSLIISAPQSLGKDLINTPNLALSSLDWFTHGFIRLQDIENKLIVTDLRMKTGQLGYAFKFAVAEKENEKWQVMTPLRL